MGDKMTEAQEEAFDTLIEKGGEDQWVPASEVGHHRTIDALHRKNVIQVTEADDEKYVALDGILEDPSPQEDDGGDTDEREAMNAVKNIADSINQDLDPQGDDDE